MAVEYISRMAVLCLGVNGKWALDPCEVNLVPWLEPTLDQRAKVFWPPSHGSVTWQGSGWHRATQLGGP